MKSEDVTPSPLVEVRLRERQVLFLAPDNDGTRQWGVYGCPDLYRADDGSIMVYDGGHMDTYDAEASAKVPAVCFRSRDNGQTWEPFAREPQLATTELREGYGAPNKWFRLADGARVQFVPKGPPADLRALGIAPRGMVVSANEYGLVGLYRATDIPLAARTFTVRYDAKDAPKTGNLNAYLLLKLEDRVLMSPPCHKLGDLPHHFSGQCPLTGVFR